MDEEFQRLVKERTDAEGLVRLGSEGGEAREVIVIGEGERQVRYKVKPLRELYGKGVNRENLDPEDPVYTPLLQGIETEISQCDAAARYRMTDAMVLLDLQKLAMNPEGEYPASPEHPIAHRIQVALRIVLSMNDYSRQDVRQALRKIRKSVEFHTREAGPRGYLRFIGKFV